MCMHNMLTLVPFSSCIWHYLLTLAPCALESADPGLLPLLQHEQERTWLLTLLEDGLRDAGDFHIFEKRYVFKLIMTYHDSALSDVTSQVRVCARC